MLTVVIRDDPFVRRTQILVSSKKSESRSDAVAVVLLQPWLLVAGYGSYFAKCPYRFFLLSMVPPRRTFPASKKDRDWWGESQRISTRLIYLVTFSDASTEFGTEFLLATRTTH